MENISDNYIENIKKSLSISNLIVGEKYYFITKNELVYLGEFYNKKNEIESQCWHDGPEIIIKLDFEYDLLKEYNFYDLSDKGFVKEDQIQNFYY
jgi:hypothetical protein